MVISHGNFKFISYIWMPLLRCNGPQWWRGVHRSGFQQCALPLQCYWALTNWINTPSVILNGRKRQDGQLPAGPRAPSAGSQAKTKSTSIFYFFELRKPVLFWKVQVGCTKRVTKKSKAGAMLSFGALAACLGSLRSLACLFFGALEKPTPSKLGF